MPLLIANNDPDAAAEFFVPRMIMVIKSEQKAVYVNKLSHPSRMAGHALIL